MPPPQHAIQYIKDEIDPPRVLLKVPPLGEFHFGRPLERGAGGAPARAETKAVLGRRTACPTTDTANVEFPGNNPASKDVSLE
jgi:hypothetical protein